MFATNLPVVAAGPTPPQPGFSWDLRLNARGAQLTLYTPRPGDTYFRCVRGEWLDESQDKPSILIEVLDEQGRRLVGQPVRCTNGGEHVKLTEAKPNDRWAVDFPMFNVGCAHRIEVVGGSDKIGCLGLGTIADPDHAHHTGYYFIFQRTTFYTGNVDFPPPPPISFPPSPLFPSPTPPPNATALLAEFDGKLAELYNLYRKALGV
jgi:hypothetical protein